MQIRRVITSGCRPMTEAIFIRISADEKEKLQELASQKGKPLSAYARELFSRELMAAA